MIDMNMKYSGVVVGWCGSCMAIITGGPNESTVNYSCACIPRNPLMIAPKPDATEDCPK